MKTIKTVNLKGLGKKYSGKVRDYYIVGDKRIIATTDRISAFDVILGFIPYKGAVLNQLSAFWFSESESGIVILEKVVKILFFENNKRKRPRRII